MHRIVVVLSRFCALACCVAGLGAGEAAAAPIPGGSYWEVTYDISDSTLDASTPSIGVVSDIALGPGTMKVQFNGTDARLSFFDLDANFAYFGIVFDLSVTMGGDANGTLGPGGIVWNTPADQFNYLGTQTCEGGPIICSIFSLPENVQVPVDFTVDENVGDLVSGFPITTPSAFPVTMSWSLQITDAAGTLYTANIIGTELGRVSVPEPGTATLLGLGLVGIAAGRRRVAARA